MVEALQREAVYLWYYLSVQTQQIAPYWAVGILLGSAVSVFAKERLHALLLSLGSSGLGLFGLVPASLLGIASPLCMFGTLPLAASFSAKGLRQDWLAAFMMASMLLNPQLLLYSAALGPRVLALRFLFCFLCGVAAGLCVRVFYRDRPFFSFAAFAEGPGRDTHPNLPLRYLFNVWRNLKATGPYFLAGIAVTALYQRYVPQEWTAGLFSGHWKGLGVLAAAALGVPLYVCGGGTIPLLAQWLYSGMGNGAAVAFMLSGPATKLTNLSALKLVFPARRFFLYVAFVLAFALVSGLIVEGLGV